MMAAEMAVTTVYWMAASLVDNWVALTVEQLAAWMVAPMVEQMVD